MNYTETTYSKYMTIKNNEDGYYQDLMKYFCSINGLYSSYKVTKARSGIYVKDSYQKLYFEYNKYTNIILKYPVKNGKIGSCCGEILLDDLEERLLELHKLIVAIDL